ncbi:hypothetical protein PSH47_04915 [Pseudoalteromonas sp. CST5]|uniref:ABC-three component system protein n=1 Tax=unclassified Pseudoalteromonas TaxID=194690 RepID=UPI002359D8FA|nr:MULTISPECIES: ABC-three component system protein [unclassified Pseudoalteromonas]MDC9513097.1 hypothetical protein [Pseudoalteromonas sp. CST1]MDC9537166.1 hypothetical protein [Pseudoalteromonas sp. CST3]MDC9541480.1 hypothetical protein [Pseudoalteromonas sp. CST2]MDC9545759.1 hypothetical protein [Pseudoalteromonas sp. CST4]MDC9548511.1 hypothetical protein [Pseudoalteromonas sp. CST5]
MSTPFYHPGPEQPTPEQRLLFFDDEKWEMFIEQCARQLQIEGNYIHVHRLGGAGDKGRDVCGYTRELPEESSWDLYQGKFYGSTLSPSAFASDLAKFLWFVFSKAYSRPSNYYICALKVGPSLLDFTLNPNKFKAWILDEWEEKSGNFATFKKELTPELKSFIQNFPFEIFKIKPPAELLEIHSRSNKHWQMFGVLPARQSNPVMPETPDTNEEQFVKALMEIYLESAQLGLPQISDIPKKFQKHFKAQRMLFYSAEGLNRFSRDKLPGAFDELKDQVEIGIGSTLSYPHADGLIRLKEVIDIANVLQVSANPLSNRLQAGDLGGTCHHLANENRVKWVDEDE